MKRHAYWLLSGLILLAACSGGSKKILVLKNNSTEVDRGSKIITVKDTKGNDEASLEYAAKKVDIKVISPDGEKMYPFTDNGWYIFNVKPNDTIFGAYQNYGSDGPPPSVDKAAVLKMIDSLEQMIKGTNINAANRNFRILPMESVKISDNEDAIVVAPFHTMSQITIKAGQKPEIYRFYSAVEIHEKIKNMREIVGDSIIVIKKPRR